MNKPRVRVGWERERSSDVELSQTTNSLHVQLTYGAQEICLFPVSPQQRSDTGYGGQAAVGSPMTGTKQESLGHFFHSKLAHLSESKFTHSPMMRIQLLGKSSGLVLQERHWQNSECVKVEVVSVVRRRIDDTIFLWRLATLHIIGDLPTYLHAILKLLRKPMRLPTRSATVPLDQSLH